ncbi:unnamed protein product [Hymenolepis diminuta]|uniref:Uncharacterized protein n=1 Tax=Hymenolepis diminuta TaxID=6216 RepID=A0A564YNK6_HYMDI|nr:unnamed protein product [Hymenolepis diminuta]VUZ48114.1 unnamed protein product [Hymenolepis diminuta]
MEHNEQSRGPTEVSSTALSNGSEGSPQDHSNTSDCWSEYFPSAQRMGSLADSAQNLLYERLATEDTEVSNELSLGGNVLITRRKYYTCVLRGYERPPANIACLYVKHDDHIHGVFDSPNNITRKIDNLLNDCRIPRDKWLHIKATCQLVRDIYKLLQYFNSRGEIKMIRNYMMGETMQPYIYYRAIIWLVYTQRKEGFKQKLY